MNYLITGSEGFIGSNLLIELKNSFVFNEKDIVDNWKNNLYELVKKSDIVFHIGAVSSTDASNINRVMFLNYEFSKILFDMADELNKKVIYSSSAAIYGNGDEIPKNLYAWTKKAAEDYGMSKLKNFVSLRYFNCYGPGENHKGKMASVVNQALFHKKNNRFEKFNLMPKFPKRDFIYVKDIISANLHAINVEKGVYDVGTGESHLFETCLNIINVPYQYYEENKIPEWYQFNTKADKNKFMKNWIAQYSLVRGIIEYEKLYSL